MSLNCLLIWAYDGSDVIAAVPNTSLTQVSTPNTSDRTIEQSGENSVVRAHGGDTPTAGAAGAAVDRCELLKLPVGQVGVVCDTCMEPRDAAMLRAMGMRPHCRVRMIRRGEPSIIEVLGLNPATGGCGCRLGLARELAARIHVLVPRVT